MASRDLTKEFVEHRNAKVALKQLEQWTDENVVDGLLTTRVYEDVELGARSSSWSEDKVIPWVQRYREVEVRCAHVECELRRMSSLQKKRLMVTFDSKEEQTLERDLSDAVTTARDDLRLAEQLLNEKHGDLEPNFDIDSKATIHAKMNAKKKLAAHIQRLSRAFRGPSTKTNTVNHDTEFDFLTNGVEKRALDMLDARQPGERLVTLEDAAAIEADEQYLLERDADIQAIASSVQDVAQIFKELAVLVIDQGTILDRIDFNMEQVAERTRHATSQLISADRHDKQARPLRCVIALLLIIFVLALILIYKLTSHTARRR